MIHSLKIFIFKIIWNINLLPCFVALIYLLYSYVMRLKVTFEMDMEMDEEITHKVFL